MDTIFGKISSKTYAKSFFSYVPNKNYLIYYILAIAIYIENSLFSLSSESVYNFIIVLGNLKILDQN